MNKKFQIPEMNGVDMHRFPDTMLAQFFLRVENLDATEKNYELGATFIGQC